MQTNFNFFCDTRLRHFRLLFLVDYSVDVSFLENLIYANYQLWGGRYNPIIPVKDGKISAFYSQLLATSDPDIIYYTARIGEDTAKKLCQRKQAKEIKVLDPNGRNNFPGVYSHHLIAEAHKVFLSHLKQFSLVYFDQHEKYPQSSFYNLSFGIGNQYIENIQLTQGVKKHTLDVSDISSTNLKLVEINPFYNCLLCQLNANFLYLRPTNDWEFNCLELIVYDDENHFEDMVYFWNRGLSQQPGADILQLIVSKSQLALLRNHDSFGNLLKSVARDNSIFLHSLSLGANELENIRSGLSSSYNYISFKVHKSRSYPQVMNAEWMPISKKAKKNRHLLLGGKNFLNLPHPSWQGLSNLFRGNYIYDIEFFSENNGRPNYLKFPFGTVPHFVLGVTDARVERRNHISIFVNEEIERVNILTPEPSKVFQSRLNTRTEFGVLIDNPIRGLRPSDAGLKLTSFTRLFNQDLLACRELLIERFWVDLLLGKSTAPNKKTFNFRRTVKIEGVDTDQEFSIKVPASNIYNNDGSFCYLDLISERRLAYLENAEQVREFLKEYMQPFDDDSVIKFIDQSISEDLEQYIDPELQSLIQKDALFIGMKVKCRHCGSNSFYLLAELAHKMSCKGCLQEVTPSIKAQLYYRFNDVLYNNTSSDPVKRSKNYHGNFVVLRTLAYFSERGENFESFNWAPSMDVGIKLGNRWKGTDIDIAMICNGKLVIGEAKATASDFNASQFEQLKVMVEAFVPDCLILAYQNGSVNEQRLQDLRVFASGFNCEVILHHVEDPNYHFGRIR